MYIFQEAETPQGATANCHRVHRVEIADGKVVVTLNSFATETSDMLIWQDNHEIPMVSFAAGNYPENVYDYLTGNTGPFSGAAVIAEQDELTKLKLTKGVSINTLREKKIADGCTTPSGIVDTDEVSVRNIMATYQVAVLAMMTSSPFEADWRLKNNTSVTLSAAEMIAMGNAVLARTKACYEHSWSLKSDIEAATSAEEVNLVDLMIGWPTV